jgi:hypothetical protein
MTVPKKRDKGHDVGKRKKIIILHAQKYKKGSFDGAEKKGP